MFLQQLPDPLRWLLLFTAGATLASFLNWAIYSLTYFVKRNCSPWMSSPDDSRQRTGLDRIPIFGWFRLRRESDLLGNGFWVRPLLIEVAFGTFVVWFFEWQMSGGLYGGEASKLVDSQKDIAASWNFGWFLFHTLLIALMTVATFIDFDERMIPDWITIPGTLIAIAGHAAAPSLRLPVTSMDLLSVQLQPLRYWTPDTPTTWHLQIYGLIAAVAVVWIWCFGLLPKWLTMRQGLSGFFKIMIASVIRPRRKTIAKVGRDQPRMMYGLTKVALAIAILVPSFLAALFFTQAENGLRWSSVFDSMMGMAMGGGIVWAVRIIASKALGEEAMGFGDVTLMCMIGAFVGWQPALLIFAFAPFTSIFVALVLFISRGESRLAFGPYLCIAAVIVVIGWNGIWNQWAKNGVFAMGNTFLLGVLFACLLMMAVMLSGWSKVKHSG